jgi:hypothetical protein
MFGTWIAPGANVTFLGPPGVFEATYTENARVATLAPAVARCRASKNDVIFALPGYSENVSSAAFASIPAGTKLIGLGVPGESSAPKLIWTAVAGTLLFQAADILFQNMTLQFNGADSIDAPITVSAAGCGIEDCRILLGSDTALDSDVGITVAAGGDNFRFLRNYVFTTGSAVVTNAVLINGAVDSPKIADNTFIVPTTSTNGIVEIGAAAVVVTNMEVSNNKLINKSTGSACIRMTDAAHTGVVYDNYSGLTANTAPGTTGISLAGTTNILVQFFQNFTNDGEAKGTSGILSPAANDGT